jgi:hypothetical protein
MFASSIGFAARLSGAESIIRGALAQSVRDIMRSVGVLALAAAARTPRIFHDLLLREPDLPDAIALLNTKRPLHILFF